MSLTRRSFILGSGGTITLFSGCTYFDDTAVTVPKLEVELGNGTGESHVFHVAIETSNGLKEWHSQEVESRISDTVTIEPPQDEDLIGIHGFVDDYPLHDEFFALDSADECVRVLIEYGAIGGDEPTLLQSATDSC